MGFFGGRFKAKGEPLKKQAQTLVQAAKINAISMFTPLLEKYPILEKADLKNWDFILTVAGVFVASSRLNILMNGNDREEYLMDIVAKTMSEWDTAGIRGFEDCNSFFEDECNRLEKDGHEIQFIASDALGIWIIWNIFGKPPESHNELKLARTLGGMIMDDFSNWWQE